MPSLTPGWRGMRSPWCGAAQHLRSRGHCPGAGVDCGGVVTRGARCAEGPRAHHGARRHRRPAVRALAAASRTAAAVLDDSDKTLVELDTFCLVEDTFCPALRHAAL